ncbi:mucin-binding protein [Lactobacillus paragasseri]|uniref:mucin-binding protein n=1 Tax=Lactobacillus paragasseri TaxID=2107999 RepID=UPI00217E70C0|nr:Rib/alpha-like domain-containing protein [Lactobacillus paragasseri]UWI43120.1 YSIRK-type signal peptide-containing protein [Lactobacillus paragasseri]
MSSNMFGDKHNHYSIRKLSVGAASVLIGATIYLGGVNAQAVRADSINGDATEQVEKKNEADVKSAEVKTTEQRQENNKTAVSATNENAKQNVAETTSDSKKVASNGDVNVIKNDVTTDEEAATKSSVQADKDVNANKLDTNTVSVNKLQRNFNVAGLTESKAASENVEQEAEESPLGARFMNHVNEFQSLSDVTTTRTVPLNKPQSAGGRETITQKLGGFGYPEVTKASNVSTNITTIKFEFTVMLTLNGQGLDTGIRDFSTNLVLYNNSWTFASAEDEENYNKFLAFQPSDYKGTLPAIKNSEIAVDGYTWKITSATPDGAGLGAETLSPYAGISQNIVIDYTKEEHTVTYKFKDPFGNQVGSSVPVTGAAGSNQSVSLTLPDGYQLASDSLPTSVTIPTSDQTIWLPVKHQLTITLSGEGEFNYADDNWKNLVETNELPASGYNVRFNDNHARVQLSNGDVTYNENRNVGTYTVSLTEKGLNDIKGQLHDNFIYPDLKDVKSEAKFIIDKGNKTISLMGGDTKVFDNTSTLPDQGTFYSGLGLADNDQGRISVYNSDGTLRTIQLTPADVEFWFNGHKIDKDQAKNVGTYNLRLTDDFINKVKAADGNNGNNYEWAYGTHTPTGSDTYTADYVIYQATGKANLSGNNSKLYDGNAVTTADVNKDGKITIDLTLPVYKQADEPGDVPQLLRTVPLGKYTLQDGDYTWNTTDGSAPTKGGSYTISLNKDKILSHLQDRLKTLAGVGTDPDSEDPDNPTPMDNVTVSAEDLAGTANYDINTSVSYQFIDNDNNDSKVGAPVVVTGLNGESKDVSLVVPEGYELVDVLPTKATFGDINRTIRINLKHKKTSVDGRDHKDDNDIYRTVTRTITVNIEGQPTQVISQKVSLYRIKTVDEALKAAGKPESEYTTYSAWTSNMSDGSTSFATVSVPADGNGYVRSITGGTIEKDKVTEQSALNNGEPAKDITVTVNYAKAEQSTTVTYVDKDGNEIKMPDGQPVAGSHYEISGKTGDTVNTDVKDKVLAGWEIISGTKYPTTVTFGSTPTSPIKVKVEHKITKTDGRNHKDKQDLYREVTRTILMNVPNATSQGKETETLSFYRIMTHDEVTGDNTYSEWKSDVAGDKTAFDEFDVSKTNDGKEIAAGYTPTSRDVTLEAKNGDKFVPSQSALKNGVPADSFIVEVAYTPNAQRTTVTYVDESGNEITNPDGSVIPGSHYDLTGVTDQSNVPTNIQNNVPTNWHITDETFPGTISFGPDGHTPITVHVAHNTKPADKDNVPDGYKKEDFDKTVTRTITAKEPSGDVDLSQHVELTRTGTYDEVTKEVTYNPWTTSSFVEVTAPEVADYTPSKASVEAVSEVTVDYVDPKVEIIYTPNAQKTTVTYVDENGNEIINPDGSVIPGSHYDVDGVTGQKDIPTNIEKNVPTNWHITDKTIPGTISFGPNGHDPIKVHVAHNTKPADKDNVPDGYKREDFDKTVTRTITAKEPSGDVDLSQHVELTRTGTYDEVTKEVTYNPWTTSSFVEVTAPEVAGYTPSKASVEAVDKVTSDYVDPKVVINYVPNDQKGKISYVDDKTNIEVGTTSLTGKTDEDVVINPVAPAGWKIVDGQNIPKTEKATPNGIDTVIVKVEHKTTTVPPTDPKTPEDKLPDNPDKHYPDGVGEKDLNKTIVRQITVVRPDGTRESHDQSVKLTRTATVDEVTGEVTKYSDWTTGNFDEYDAPVIAGYTPSQAKVDGVKVTADSNFDPVVITYVEDPIGQDITVKKGDTPSPEDGVKNHGDLDKVTDPKHPDAKTTYTWKKTPDTSVAGDVPATVIVHYPDGSNKPVDITVHVVDDTPVVPTKNPDPVGQDITVKKGDTPDPEDGVKNHGDLDKIIDPKHPGTKTTYTWKKTPDTSVAGDVPATVVVHYPDGSEKPVDITVHVVDDIPVVPTKNPEPTGQDIHTPQGKVPTPESAITNKDKMPDGTKYTWKEIPDVNTLGKHPSVVVVTYPDGTAVEVKVNVFVDGTPEAKKETKAPVVKKQVVEPTKVETRQKLVNNYVAPRAVEVQRAQAKGKRQLPQTGAKENIASEVLGMLSVGLGALTAGFASKRRKKNR